MVCDLAYNCFMAKKTFKPPERVKSEIKHFSENDEWWGAKTVAGAKRYDNKFEMFKKYCKPKQSERVLEIGCGNGLFTTRLLKSRTKITATDVTAKPIIRCHKNIQAKNVIFKVENAENLSFKDNTFDIVCGISILHHLDQERALKEAYRILCSRGQIFFTEPNLINPQINLGLRWFRKQMEFSPNETAIIRWHMEKLLKKIGYSKFKVVNYGFLHPQTPQNLVDVVEKIERVLEKTPLIKEISGSLIIWAEK